MIRLGLRWWLVGMCGLLVVVTSACVSIPHSGEVHAGGALAENQDVEPPLNAPGRPLVGASPEQVVDGFFRSMAGYPQDLDIARLFLTQHAAATWEPQDSTRVLEQHTVAAGASGSVVVDATESGALSARGTWRSAPYPGRSFDRTFSLVREDGQWRITNPPQALLISQDYFERYYAPYSLYFPGETGTTLVPDPIYVPVGPQVATLLAQGLLAGPTPWLAGAVRGLVPAGTTVDLSVPVSAAGTAQVSLSDSVQDLGPDERVELLAQFLWTLGQVPGIAKVELTTGGEPFAVSGLTRPVGVNELSAFDPAGLSASGQIYGINKGRMVKVDANTVGPVSGVFGQPGIDASSLAVDSQALQAAVVSANRQSVRVAPLLPSSDQNPEASTVWYAGAHNLIRPAWDESGRLWLIDNDPSGARLIVVGADLVARHYVVPRVTGQDVRAIRVSRDGTRLAVVVGTGADSSIVLARIVRKPNGSVIRVDRAYTLQNPYQNLTNIVDVGWVAPTALSVLAGAEARRLLPYIVSIDGSEIVPSTGLPNIGARVITSSPNPEVPLVVGSADGALWLRRSDLRWGQIPVRERVWRPTYPG
jgi:Lipoprotein LpqB beta-propeller domain/Sporulation and spore germination